MAEITHKCLCFSGIDYTECCYPYHMGKKVVETPAHLVRTRYTAFCHGDVGYLVSTIHPKAKYFGISRAIRRTIRTVQWAGLKVITQSIEGDRAFVEFVAFHLTTTALEQLHEKARFMKYKDEWCYVDGEILPPINLSRNDPCYCGSGKKFKKCHARLVDRLESKTK